MARLTENPKFIALGILISLGLGLYLYFPDMKRLVMAPPKKPKPAPAVAKPGEDQRKFYRLVPDKLPDKIEVLLDPPVATRTLFDEVPRREKSLEEKGEPPAIPEGWRLTSVWISPERRAAVVSGVVVTEGEALGPFTVAKIESDRVVLKHPFGERVLSFTQSVSAAPPAAANSPEGSAAAKDEPPPAGLIQQAIQGLRAWQKNQEALDQLLNPKKP